LIQPVSMAMRMCRSIGVLQVGSGDAIMRSSLPPT
jgi:hypothetical protein